MSYQVKKTITFDKNNAKPVSILKGAILEKDNGGRVIQLKLCNTGKGILNKVSVKIICFNQDKQVLGTQKYEYEKIFVKSGEIFGTDIAIPLKYNDTDTFSVEFANDYKELQVTNSKIGIKNDKKNKDISKVNYNCCHFVILFVIAVTLFLQFNKIEFSFYCRYLSEGLDAGFASLIICPVVSFVLCSKAEYKKNLIWLLMSSIGIVIQILLSQGLFSFHAGAAIDIILNIVLFGFAVILMLQNKSSNYLMIIVPNGVLCLYLALRNIIIRNVSEYYERKVSLFMLSIIAIFVSCYIFKKLKHNKILTCIFFALTIIMFIIFNRPYSNMYYTNYYTNLLCNLIQLETIGFSFVLILEWAKDKYSIRKRSRQTWK